jgi:hypothetical protein
MTGEGDSYTDWFVVGRAHDNGGMPTYVDDWMLQRLLELLQRALRFTSRIRVYSCVQEIPHVHGIIRTKTPMTQSHVNAAIRSRQCELHAEPIKKNIQACETYIMSQATSQGREYDNPDACEKGLSGPCRTIDRVSAETLHFTGSARTAAE